jgi:hypothetical protein
VRCCLNQQHEIVRRIGLPETEGGDEASLTAEDPFEQAAVRQPAASGGHQLHQQPVVERELEHFQRQHTCGLGQHAHQFARSIRKGQQVSQQQLPEIDCVHRVHEVVHDPHPVQQQQTDRFQGGDA